MRDEGGGTREEVTCASKKATEPRVELTSWYPRVQFSGCPSTDSTVIEMLVGLANDRRPCP